MSSSSPPFTLPASRFLLPALCLLLPASFSSAQRPPAFDAGRLQTGLFLYRTVVDGKETGSSQIRIGRTDPDTFSLTNLVEGMFSQSWESVATRGLVPISAKLITGSGKEARTVFELFYRGGRVTGFATSSKESGRRAVDEAVAADTVDQRIDWAAVMALKELTPGSRFACHVYDPGTGHSPVEDVVEDRLLIDRQRRRLRIGTVVVEVPSQRGHRVCAPAEHRLRGRLSWQEALVLGPATIVVPAGPFETTRIEYRIDKKRGSETYVVFVRSELPRFLVKETFPNGAETELMGSRK